MAIMGVSCLALVCSWSCHTRRALPRRQALCEDGSLGVYALSCSSPLCDGESSGEFVSHCIFRGSHKIFILSVLLAAPIYLVSRVERGHFMRIEVVRCSGQQHPFRTFLRQPATLQVSRPRIPPVRRYFRSFRILVRGHTQMFCRKTRL